MSKYQSYDDYRAVCPYYRGARANELVCEGACDVDEVAKRKEKEREWLIRDFCAGASG